MNIFKKNPIRIFEIVAATFLVVLAYYLVIYFHKTQYREPKIEKPEQATPPVVEKEAKQQFVNYDQFGVVHIEVDSPSFAKSNFDVNPQTAVVVYFNEKVDLEDVENSFSLINEDTGEEVVVTAVSEARNGAEEDVIHAWKWQEVWEEKVVFEPVEELKPLVMHEVEVRAGFYNRSRTGKAANNFKFEFLTADDPGVLSTNLDNKDFKIRSEKPLKVVFKSPVSMKELSEKVYLIPQTEIDIEVNDKIMTINTILERGDYTLVIPSGVEDLYGRPFNEDFTVDFTVI